MGRGEEVRKLWFACFGKL